MDRLSKLEVLLLDRPFWQTLAIYLGAHALLVTAITWFLS